MVQLSGNAQITIANSSSCFADTLRATLIGLTPVDAGITADDGWSSVVPIGFNYTFYGNVYNQCIIGSNGCLGFDVSYASGYNTWPISSTLISDAGSGDIHNLIAGPWCDIYIPAGGSIMYSTVGTAPNRKFECTWCGVAMYDCTTQWITTQIIIYETTNIAEVHIGHHTYCTYWNGGYAECGVKNATGTAATVAPGRDYPSNWAVTNEAWRFTPVGTTSYTCSSIAYAPVPYAASAVYWYDSTTRAYLGTGTTLTVTPSTTTTYMACAVGCLDTSRAYITCLPVGTGSSLVVPHISSFTVSNPRCGLPNGSITLHGLVPHLIDTVFEARDGVPVTPFVDSAASDSTITISGLDTGTYTIYVKVGPCPSNTIIATLVTTRLAISSEGITNPTLCGLCNATFTLHGLWPGDTATVGYNYNGVPRTYTGIVAFDSTITIPNLCGAYPVANLTAVSVTVNTCTAGGTDEVITDPPISAAATNPSLCGKQDGSISLYNLPADSLFIVNYTGHPMSYFTADMYDDSLKVPYLSGGTYNVTASIHGSQCSVSGVILTMPPINAVYTDPTICGKPDGTITLYNLPPDSVFTVTFSGPGAGSGETLTVNNMDSLVIPNLIAGPSPSPYTTITASIDGISCVLAAPITLTDPGVTASFIALPEPKCHGDQASFDCSASTPGGYYALWNFGDASAPGSGITTSHTYNDYPADSGTYTVTLEYYTYPDADPACKVTATAVVSFNHVIIAAFTPQDIRVCLNPPTPINFMNNSVATNPVSYKWSFGDGSTSTETSPTYTYTQASSPVFVVTLTATDNTVGCDSTVYGNVTVVAVSVETFTHDTTVCLIRPLEMIAIPHGNYDSIQYAWTNNIDATVQTDSLAYCWGVGLYQYTVTVTAFSDALQCIATDTETVDSKAALQLTNVTLDTTIYLGSSVQLNADSADYFAWYPTDGSLSNGNINNPVATPTDSTRYMVVGISTYGCKDTAYVTVRVIDQNNSVCPTAFSPNGDGLNDVFRVVNIGFNRLMDFKVFDRWGNMVFHTTNKEDGWDGTYKGVPQDIDTYYYTVLLAQPDGATKLYTGSVILIR